MAEQDAARATVPAEPSGDGDGRIADETPVRARLREDHEAIARLAEDLLPALIAKLTASGLGEIEVREGGWKARLRKPDGAAATAPHESKRAGWTGAGQGQAGHTTHPGHAGHAHTAGRALADGPRRPCDDDEEPPSTDPRRSVVTSPAVGIYHPRRDLTVGMRVRAGDKIGTVDVLGIREEVASPVDGVVGASLVEAGDAVEFGQDLVRIELPGRAHAAEEAVAALAAADEGPQA